MTGPSGARLVPAEEFFVSHLTSCLEPDEIVTEVRFPVTAAPAGASGFAEVAPRHGDYAVCAVACALRVEDGVVAEARLGAARGLRPAAAAARPPSARWWAPAASPRRSPRRPARRAAAVDPSDGMHASAEYRRHLTGVLAGRAAAARLRHGGRDERARRSPSTAAACTSTSTTACCCPTSCATRSACAARTSAASTACAAPARCSSTAAPCARA